MSAKRILLEMSAVLHSISAHVAREGNDSQTPGGWIGRLGCNVTKASHCPQLTCVRCFNRISMLVGGTGVAIISTHIVCN